MNNIAVHSHSDESLFSDSGKKLFVAPFAIGNHRSQQNYFGTFRLIEQDIDHILYRLGTNFVPALGTAWPPASSKQEPEMIIDLGNRANS